MKSEFLKPKLSSDQKKRIKKLYSRNNHRGHLAILIDYGWIAFACWLAIAIHPGFYVLSLVMIGARQRALASLLHEAAHGTLFRSKILNITIGRFLCGWPILQSYGTYRRTHVLAHHPKIGDRNNDPDYQYMESCGVYDPQTKKEFVGKFLVRPLLGLLTPQYITFLVRDRFFSAFKNKAERTEAIAILVFHFAIGVLAQQTGWLLELTLFWWIPFLIVHPIIGWFSELSEHYPFMGVNVESQYFSRNRYAGWLERKVIGMHGDHLHLTHHLLPGVPHWNLEAATAILREDPAFCEWDNRWGGIFTSDDPSKVSLVKFVSREMEFHTVSHIPATPHNR